MQDSIAEIQRQLEREAASASSGEELDGIEDSVLSRLRAGLGTARNQ